MSETQINNCIETLQKKPNLFRKENIAEKLRCLDMIKDNGTPGIIWFLVSFLRSDNILIQTKAAETILALFGKLSSPNEFLSALKYLSITIADLDFYRVDFDEKTYGGLLAIASLNRNGYVREHAVKELGRLKTEHALKFVLVRFADWVPAVRKAASAALPSFLENAHVEELLRHLTITEWLLEVKRVDLSAVHDQIIGFLLNKSLSEGFYEKIKRLDERNRFIFYKAFVKYKVPDAEWIGRLLRDKNFLVRLELLQNISVFDEPDRKTLIAKFLQDRSTRVRLDSLYKAKPFLGDFDEQVFYMLSDKAASVRDLSRRLLKGRADFASIYRQRIDEGQLVAGSLSGLAETGSEKDLPIFEQYIFSEKSEFVLVSLLAISKFNPGKGEEYALKLLVHPVQKVKEKAVEILAKANNREMLEKVRTLYSNSDFHKKKMILRLYTKIGGWGIVADLLLTLNDEDIRIQDLGWQMLEKWKVTATRLFTTPLPGDIERANKIYDDLNLSHLQMTAARSNLLRDLKFYIK